MIIRPVEARDREAVLKLTARLAQTGTPPGRDQAQVEAADRDSIAGALDSPSALAQIFVAEDKGRVLGFVHAKTVVDYYTQQQIGHISDLVVDANAQGGGIGRGLVAAAQNWALERGYPMMQLFVLPENVGARALYERTGYRPEWIKYVMPLK